MLTLTFKFRFIIDFIYEFNGFFGLTETNFSKTEMLHTENNLNKRLFLEMIEIQKDRNSMNKKTNIKDLSNIIYLHNLLR